MTSVSAVVVPAAKRLTSTLIFMHGLGDTGHGWVSVSENFRLRRKFDECAFIFPHAPSIPITVNMGMRMPGWFDVTSFGDISHKEDEAGIMKSVELLHKIIDEQIAKGVASERIVVGGFSQGGAIALLGGISCPHKLGGIVAMSTWLACHDKVSTLVQDANKDTPIFMAHGEIDPLIRIEWAEQSRDILIKDYGKKIEWHSYPNLEHSADPQEINHLQMWLEKRIPPLGM
ncbi:Phospholipase/carboxylesterase/thioesterase [Tricharina praecox]|uniref:Phospholipase/carboxylesterase/thioesterase n=1 Tax=Tricharina praecox TaxID=43433 RepID=UPI00221FF03C|nr:Phospholipase/carboxylesterase/thioesterase [Tricharina praecox]KAI5847486.1 Phospholipase/carboxylesterase/thioesterase [Tricharina praecox]